MVSELAFAVDYLIQDKGDVNLLLPSLGRHSEGKTDANLCFEKLMLDESPCN
jgi:hypothetical protein